MRTKLHALGLSIGLGLLSVSAPAVVAADGNSTAVQVGANAAANRVIPGRPTNEVRQELRQARHYRGQVAEVPELSASLAAQGLCLLLGATLLMHERRRRTA